MNCPPVDKAINRRIGCFTLQPEISQSLFDAGIPMWFIRPIESMTASMSLTEVVSMVHPKDHLRLERGPNEDFPVIYRGPADDDMHYMSQHKFTRTRMVFMNCANGKKVMDPTKIPSADLGIESHARSLRSIKSDSAVDRRGKQPCK
jgi:hypothetical protein